MRGGEDDQKTAVHKEVRCDIEECAKLRGLATETGPLSIQAIKKPFQEPEDEFQDVEPENYRDQTKYADPQSSAGKDVAGSAPANKSSGGR